MKSVLISIQPRGCELIISGKKTVEVRKTKPKLETPFKCYIYCTKNKEKLTDVIHEGDEVYGFVHKGKPNFIKIPDENSTIYGMFKGGKIVGEFVCDEIEEFLVNMFDPVFLTTSALSCVSEDEIMRYLGGKDYGYGWHISNLVIYDKPRELNEFKRWVDRSKGQRYHEDMLYLQSAPQSYCYVEETE